MTAKSSPIGTGDHESPGVPARAGYGVADSSQPGDTAIVERLAGALRDALVRIERLQDDAQRDFPRPQP